MKKYLESLVDCGVGRWALRSRDREFVEDRDALRSVSKRFIVRAEMASATDRVVSAGRQLLVACAAGAIALVVAGCAFFGGNDPGITALFATGETVTYEGPTAVATGEPFTATLCVRDRDGNPVSGKRVLTTLGDPPSSENATHGSGTTDENGCVEIEMDVNWPAGTTVLWFSDGDEVVRGTSMDVA